MRVEVVRMYHCRAKTGGGVGLPVDGSPQDLLLRDSRLGEEVRWRRAHLKQVLGPRLVPRKS